MDTEMEIILPDNEQAGALIDNAWQDFCAEAKAQGYDISQLSASGWAKDCFAAGYCAGHNDILNIIFEQVKSEREIHRIINQRNK